MEQLLPNQLIVMHEIWEVVVRAKEEYEGGWDCGVEVGGSFAESLKDNTVPRGIVKVNVTGASQSPKMIKSAIVCFLRQIPEPV